MLICKYCETRLKSSDHYCPNCNSIINPNTVIQTEEPPSKDSFVDIKIKKKGTLYIYMGLGLIIFQIVAFFGSASYTYAKVEGKYLDYFTSYISERFLLIVIGIILFILGISKRNL